MLVTSVFTYWNLKGKKYIFTVDCTFTSLPLVAALWLWFSLFSLHLNNVGLCLFTIQYPSSSECWSSIGIPSGKFNFFHGSWFATIPSSYAMAASLALVKTPRYVTSPSMLICALNFFVSLDTPLKFCLVAAVSNFSSLYFRDLFFQCVKNLTDLGN